MTGYIKRAPSDILGRDVLKDLARHGIIVIAYWEPAVVEEISNEEAAIEALVELGDRNA